MEATIQNYYEQIDHEQCQSCDEKIAGTNSCSECCSAQYFDGNDIDYSCEQKRKVYLIRYLPVHVKENYLAASRIPEEIFEELVDIQPLNILSLGGGPGSDVAAVKKMIIERYDEDSKLEINIRRLDIVSDWDPIAHDVIYIYKDKNITFNHFNTCADIATQNISLSDTYNIITLSYLLSEIENENLECLSENIKNLMADTCVIIINDRNEDAVKEKINVILDNIGYNNIEISDTPNWCGFSYPNEIKERMIPKLNTSSIQYTVVCEQ